MQFFSPGQAFKPSASYFNDVSEAVEWTKHQKNELSKPQGFYRHSGIVWVKVNGAFDMPRFGFVKLTEPLFLPDGTAWDEDIREGMLGRVCFKADAVAGNEDYWSIYAEYKHVAILQAPFNYQEETLAPAVVDGVSWCKLTWTDPGANKPGSYPTTAYPGGSAATAGIYGPLKIIWKEDADNDDGFRWGLVKVDSWMHTPNSVRGTMDAAVTMGGSGTLNLTDMLGGVSAVDVDVPYFDVEEDDPVRVVWDEQLRKYIVIAIECPT
jgi:hypothetical protein